MARSYDLASGSIPQHLLRLAAPLIMGNILQQLYNTVDAFILGRFAGELEFAAVGVAGSVMNLFLFMITGACTGISVIFAQLYGAGDRTAFRREHWLSLSFGALVTVICSGLGFFLLPPLLRLIRTPEELAGFVTAYLTIILVSLPTAFLYNLYGALLRAIGRANAALMALAAAVTVNVALDYCFVARFRWGIAGAAWATAASQATSAAVCILYLQRCDLRARGAEPRRREGRARARVLPQQSAADARNGACDVFPHVRQRGCVRRLHAGRVQRRGV